MRTRSSIWYSSTNTSEAEKPGKTTGDRCLLLPQNREDYEKSFVRGDGDGFLGLPRSGAVKDTSKQHHHSKSTVGSAHRPITDTPADQKKRRLFADSGNQPDAALHGFGRVLRSDRNSHKKLPADCTSETPQLHHRVLRSGSQKSGYKNQLYLKSPTKTESGGDIAARGRRLVAFQDPGVLRRKEVVPEVIGQVVKSPTFDQQFSDDGLEDAAGDDDDEVSEAGNRTAVWDGTTILILVLFAAVRFLYDMWSSDFTLTGHGFHDGFGLSGNQT